MQNSSARLPACTPTQRKRRSCFDNRHAAASVRCCAVYDDNTSSSPCVTPSVDSDDSSMEDHAPFVSGLNDRSDHTSVTAEISPLRHSSATPIITSVCRERYIIR